MYFQELGEIKELFFESTGYCVSCIMTSGRTAFLFSNALNVLDTTFYTRPTKPQQV